MEEITRLQAGKAKPRIYKAANREERRKGKTARRKERVEISKLASELERKRQKCKLYYSLPNHRKQRKRLHVKDIKKQMEMKTRKSASGLLDIQISRPSTVHYKPTSQRKMIQNSEAGAR
ncbi:hypothetical protein CCACVL1_14146 [Corchorus capsularis]|uniref:Uncharacterized protein n=1 Tax=Corchorus capsularis TaxID=210143 RepID=A0A1R3I866_COCAP|nr:hypothetical protein CCACVL1_14146 [Corchorus capsularis]